MKRKLILASASPRRKELLSQIGLSFEVRVSHAKEDSGETKPGKLVKELSALKARNVFRSLSEEEKKLSLVLGADTVVVLDGEIMGKPKDKQDAFAMLQKLQGRTHRVYTGVTLLYQENGKKRKCRFCEKTKVTVASMTEEEIRNYIDGNEPMDKAGGYAIQGAFAAYISRIDGDYANVVGLPTARVYQELKKLRVC